jgi:CheY-like chemotaxis protein
MKKRILIVDDDINIRLLLRLTMEEGGYEAVEARDGDEAIARFKETPFDLVIADMVMPHKDGISMLLEIRQLNPNVPFVAISGGAYLGSDHYLEIARLVGVKQTFSKPVDRKALLAVVAEMLQPKAP